ncbi:hypothetical protein PR048_031957 [Dryococelus australis]|uniref:Uncharacterized protein n=1 Tax=Dryococelus australis TaxID=614101 RepID=A0ABQ9G6S5_9NEOP|nr:hypothetical protein PR048_031957 [Dryococelus australis]
MQDAGQKLAPINELTKKEKGALSKVTTEDTNIIIHMTIPSTFAGGKTMEQERRLPCSDSCPTSLQPSHGTSGFNGFTHWLVPTHYKRQTVVHAHSVPLASTYASQWALKIKKMNLLRFKSSVATSLIFQGISKQNKRGWPSDNNNASPAVKRRVVVKAPQELRLDGGKHYPKKTERKYAALCHLRECKKKTRYKCNCCNEPLCPECFEDFHNLR